MSEQCPFEVEHWRADGVYEYECSLSPGSLCSPSVHAFEDCLGYQRRRAEVAEGEVERLKTAFGELHDARRELAKDLSAAEVEKLNLKAALAVLGEGWDPTEDAINALPVGVKRLVRDLEEAGDCTNAVTEAVAESEAALTAANARVEAAQGLVGKWLGYIDAVLSRELRPPYPAVRISQTRLCLNDLAAAVGEDADA